MSKPNTDFKILCPDCGAETFIGKKYIRKCSKCTWDIEKKQREEEDRIRYEEWMKLSPEERQARQASFQGNLKNLSLILPWLIQ
jgi:ribosomal protein L37E